jgi:hypothetical protein
MLLLIGFSNQLTAQSSSLAPFNEAPLRGYGQNVIPVYDGWFQNPDESYTLCFGYFNMNTEESIDVPFGTSNKIEPVEFDGVQPTHFDPVPQPALSRPFRHHWCVFSVEVPSDFGTQDVVWTLTTQGNELSVPASLIPSYVLDEPATSGRGAIAPFLSLDDSPPNFHGRRGLWVKSRNVRVGEELPLIARIRHPEAGTWLGWALHQGPGEVNFSKDEIRLQGAEGIATSTASFSTAGTYVLRVQAINDIEQRSNPTYGFEFHCCWTNGFVRVNVID